MLLHHIECIDLLPALSSSFRGCFEREGAVIIMFPREVLISAEAAAAGRCSM
jgi:hypothetical protein